MTSIEYLNILNDKIKEKLIGLSQNKKIIDAYEDDLFSNNNDLDTNKKKAMKKKRKMKRKIYIKSKFKNSNLLN